MNFEMKIDSEQVVAKMTDRAAKVPEALGGIVERLTLKLLSAVQARAPVKSGRLRRSIFGDVTINNYQALGKVYVTNDAPYARIQEYGGKTSAHDIIPTKAQALAFMVGGNQVFAKIVHHPGSVIPAKNYVHGPFSEMTPEIVQSIETAVREAVK